MRRTKIICSVNLSNRLLDSELKAIFSNSFYHIYLNKDINRSNNITMMVLCWPPVWNQGIKRVS
ncbi:hypothetical protein HZS_1321 [Henneguya salminicola]|nr:hypothetical protein HZS_1321 [Henneguya salminicola]